MSNLTGNVCPVGKIFSALDITDSMPDSFDISTNRAWVRLKRLASASGEFLCEIGKTVNPALKPPMMVVNNVIESASRNLISSR